MDYVTSIIDNVVFKVMRYGAEGFSLSDNMNDTINQLLMSFRLESVPNNQHNLRQLLYLRHSIILNS